MKGPAVTQIYSATKLAVDPSKIILNVSGNDKISAQFNCTIDTPGNKTFASTAVDTGADTLTVTAHGYVTGLKVQFSTDGALPTGLSAATNYWLIVVDANTLKVATSRANAVAGTAIDLTAQGSGNDTITPQTFDQCTVVIDRSLDGVNFVLFSPSQTVSFSATSPWIFELGAIDYPYIRISITAPTSGSCTLTGYLYGTPTPVLLS